MLPPSHNLLSVLALQSYQYQQRVCISYQQKGGTFPGHHEQGKTGVKSITPSVHKLVKSTCISCQIFKAYVTVLRTLGIIGQKQGLLQQQALSTRSWNQNLEAKDFFASFVVYAYILVKIYIITDNNKKFRRKILRHISCKKRKAFFRYFSFLHQMMCLKELREMLFISSKKLFSFSRYSDFYISLLLPFSPCQPLVEKMIEDRSQSL